MTTLTTATHAGVRWRDAQEAARVLGRAAPRPPEDLVSLAEASGRVLAQDVPALSSLPRLATSAMDGWAVADSDDAGEWRVGVPLLAGDVPTTQPLRCGEARPIATGAPVPPGAFAVLRSEHGDVVHRLLRRSPLAPARLRHGEHIRPAGEEASEGDLLLHAGVTLTPPRVALAAAAGYDALRVASAVPVDLVVLGDELVGSGEPRPGEVRDAFGPSLPALLRGLGFSPAQHVRCPDDARRTLAALTDTEAPVVVTTGGSARGPADFVRGAITGVGGRIVIDGVAMRPGHPVMVASLPGERLLLALPGNPLAALLCLVAIGTPLADGLLGRRRPSSTRGVLAADAAAPSASVRLVACVDSDHGLVPLPWQGSGMLRGLAGADAVVVVPAGGARAGDAVELLPLPW